MKIFFRLLLFSLFTTASAASGETPTSSGTCFFVSSDGIAVTNAHVISGARDIRLLYDGAEHRASIASINLSNDLVVLRSEVKPREYLPLADDSYAMVGDEVFTMGFPATTILGNEPKFTDGSISSLSGLMGDASRMQITVPVQPGNSGGPLVNENGEVVGIIVSSAAAAAFMNFTGSLPQNVNWAIKTAYLRPMLRDLTVSGTNKKTLGTSRRQTVEAVRSSICRVLGYDTRSPRPSGETFAGVTPDRGVLTGALVFERPNYSNEWVHVKLVAIQGPDIRGITLPEAHSAELGDGRYTITLLPWISIGVNEEPKTAKLQIQAGHKYWITGQRLEDGDWKPVLYKETGPD
jgi:S1-C subfamily serine protease